MTNIEHRREAHGAQPDYSGRVFTEDDIAQGIHRNFIGGHWDSHGQHQLEFLKSRGLRPEHRFLDIGSGPFRAGRHLIDYLEPAHYYGVDANLSLLQTGYDVELTDEQRAKLPPDHLRANDRFDVDFGVPIDYAIAQSVFTHVSLNHVRLCLFRTAKAVRPGGSFFATFFERGMNTPVDTVVNPQRPKPLFTEKNVFWYYRSDFQWAARLSPWRVNYIGDWGHPVGQKMIEFVRLTDEEWAAAKAPAKKAPAKQPPAAPVDQPLSVRTRKTAARYLRGAARRLDKPQR